MVDVGSGAVRIDLDRAELGQVWHRSGLPVLPAVLAARVRMAALADDTTGAVIPRLQARGLLGPRGELHPALRQMLGVLSGARFELDLRFVDGAGVPVGAVAAVRANTLVLAVSSAHRISLRLPAGHWTEDMAGGALAGLLPEVPPASGTAVSLPVEDVVDAVLAALEKGGSSTAAELVEGLARRGVDRVDARMFSLLTYEGRVRLAKFGLTVRDRAGVRRRAQRVVRVTDSERGRAVVHSRGGFLIATPADEQALTRALAELCELARG